MNVSRLTLAEMLNVSPASSVLRELVASARFYGLTIGGINAEEFGLTPLGNEATGGDEVAQLSAYKRAVLNVAPYKAFFHAFNTKKVPSATAFKEFLTKNAEVPAERAEECMEFMGSRSASPLTRSGTPPPPGCGSRPAMPASSLHTSATPTSRP